MRGVTAANVSQPACFETVPPRPLDLQELVRWQIKKSAPFPLEQAVVSFTPGARPAEGGHEFIVATARHDIIAQYEEACAAAGAYAGLVDLATFSVINGVVGSSAAPTGDWLLVHVTASYTTLTVLRGSDLIFFRNRDNVCLLRTFSKAYGLAGLRVGYGVAPPQVADAIRKCSLPFGVSQVAQNAAVASLRQEPAL